MKVWNFPITKFDDPEKEVERNRNIVNFLH